jgi:myo-inositol catabolism protein IolC
MRKIETIVYKFDELSAEAQDKAIDKLYDINVDYQWWDSVYDDAENVGIRISEFDLDRNRHCKGRFINYALDTAEAILVNHGNMCETYKTAEAYLAERAAFIKSEMAANADDDEFTEDDIESDDIDMDFLKSILEDYSIMLQHEYDYLTSSEAIKATIDANEYEFDINGNLA